MQTIMHNSEERNFGVAYLRGDGWGYVSVLEDGHIKWYKMSNVKGVWTTQGNPVTESDVKRGM